MVKHGGEPITVNAAVATGLLTAVEELYRKNHKKSKVGGKNSKKNKDPLTGLATSAILATAAKNVSHDNVYLPQPGGDNKNEPLTGFATSAILATAAKQVSPRGGNKKNKNGGDPMSEMYDKKTGGMLGSPIDASHLLLDRTNDVVGGSKKNKNNKDNKKEGGGDVNANIGITHDFAGYRSEPASVNAPLSIIMNADGSMPKVGGGKKKRNNKKVGGNINSGVSHDFAGYRSEPAPVDAPQTILMPEKQVGGVLKLPQLTGGNKKRNNKDKKDKKLIGGLAELSKLLADLGKLA
jgi:hypothetical protein